MDTSLQSDNGSSFPTGRLRVAVIPARFDPGLNYQENVFAGALHSLGHEVVVFVAGKHDSRKANAELPFRVERDQSALQFRTTVLPFSQAFAGKIRAFDPQLAVILAPNHGPGAIWIGALSDACVVISCFSDLPWHRPWWVEMIKKMWARRVIRRSVRVLAATTETAKLVKSWVAPDIGRRVVMSGLTFNPAALEGGVLPEAVANLRQSKRSLIVMVTRITAQKKLERVFESIATYLRNHPDTGFAFAGFAPGDEAVALRNQIEHSDVAGQCVLLPFAEAKTIGALFRASDISIWSLVSIGIYHSLHCGCRILLREGQDAGHLLKSGVAGAAYANEDALPAEIGSLLQTSVSRATVSAVVEKYTGRAVVAGLIEELATER